MWSRAIVLVEFDLHGRKGKVPSGIRLRGLGLTAFFFVHFVHSVRFVNCGGMSLGQTWILVQ